MSPAEFDTAVAGATTGERAEGLARFDPEDNEVSETVKTYASRGFREVNGALRQAAGGEIADGPDAPLARRIKSGMDRAMAGQSLGDDIVVHRGVRDQATTFGHDGDLTGMTFRDDGYVSTAVAFNPGLAFVGGAGGVNMRILVPKGTPAISHADLLDGGEVVLDRGLSFHVVRDNGVSQYGIRSVDVEVLQ